MYNIARKLPGAEQVFLVMGYQQQQQGEGQVLEYLGEVNKGAVLETATDLLVMYEEVRVIREEVKRLYHRGMGHGLLERVIMDRSEGTFQHGYGIVAADGLASHGDGQLQLHGPPLYGQQHSLQERGEARGVEGSRRISDDLLAQSSSVQVNAPPQAGPAPGVVYPSDTTAMYLSPAVSHAYPDFQIQQRRQHERLHHQTHNAYAGSGGSYGASPLIERGVEGCWDIQKVSGWASDGNAQSFPHRDGVQQQNVGILQGAQQASYQPGYPPAGKSYASDLQSAEDAAIYENAPLGRVGSHANVRTVPPSVIGYGSTQSGPMIYQNICELQQVESNLENTSVMRQVQDISKQNYLSHLPPLALQDTEEEDLYGDGSIPAPTSTPPNSPRSNPASFDPANLPDPIVNLEDSGRSSDCYSGITSSLVDARSSGEGGHLSPMEEQPRGLGDAINEDLQPQSLLERFSSTESKESSLDIYGSGPLPRPRGILQKLPSVTEEPVDSKRHGKAQTPTFQTSYPPQQQFHPVPKPRVPRGPRTQQKSYSVDELEDSDNEIHRLKTTLSGSNLVKYEAMHSTEKLVPTPCNHSSFSPTSSPSNSPKPARRKVLPIHGEPSPIPSPVPKQLVIPTTLPMASSVDTEIQRRKEIQESKPVHCYSSGSNLNETVAQGVMPHAATPVLGISIAEFSRKAQRQSQTSASQPPASQYPQTSQAAQPMLSPRQSSGTSNPQTVRMEATSEPAAQTSGQLHQSKSNGQLPKDGTLSTPREPGRKTFSPASFTPLRGKSPASVSVNPATASTATVLKSNQVQQKQVSDTSDKSKLRRQEHARHPASGREHKSVPPRSSPSHNVAEADSFEEIARDRSNTTAEMEQFYNISLGETWTCAYCTNLVKATRKDCDVCGREKL